jgi:predicted alpha/beta-fold hydrolase
MHPFSPPFWLRGGHRMTIVAWARPRRLPGLPSATPRYFEVAPTARVLAACHWQDRPAEHPTLLALHGLEGSSHAQYMMGMADKAFRRGFNVVRLNQRNCGGTEQLSEGLYHSGLTADPVAVLTELAERDGLNHLVVAGYSLGGNLALKLAGDFGADAPAWLRAVCAVSPTLELSACMDLLEQVQNRLYEWNFVTGLRARIRRKARLFPGLYDVGSLWRVRTVRQFDERFTAPHNGFKNAADYYYRASSMRVIDRIRVPTLIITAQDDPFIPVAPVRADSVAGNPNITRVITQYGGHCGYVESARAGYDGYWAEQAIIEFAEHVQAGTQRGH